MPLVRAGAASIHDPKQCRAEDRVVCGEHAWAVLSGTVNTVAQGDENEADAAAPVAEALVRANAPPSLDAMHDCLLAMDRAVAEWAGRSEHDLYDLWGFGLGAVLLTVEGDVARIAHVGMLRAYRLTAASAGNPFVAEALTVDHSLAELARRRSDLASATPADQAILLSSLGHGHVARIDLSRVRLMGKTRLVLVSRGALRGLEMPLGYLRDVRSPVEAAQRICTEARGRAVGAGERARHASAIVVDVDPEPTTGPYR